MTESDFQFLGFRVSEVTFKVADTFGSNPESIQQNINIENNYSTEDKRFVEIVLNIKIDSESSSFTFFLKLKGAFKASDKMDDEMFKKLSQVNGPAILFPFARSIVASYTSQAGIPPILLPVVNLVPDTVKKAE